MFVVAVMQSSHCHPSLNSTTQNRSNGSCNSVALNAALVFRGTRRFDPNSHRQSAIAVRANLSWDSFVMCWFGGPKGIKY